MIPTSSRVLAVLALLACSAAAAMQRGRDDLTMSFERWFKDFRAGKIDPGDRQAERKSYLEDRFVRPMRGKGRGHDRLSESEELFELMCQRGSAEDAASLIEVIEVSLQRKGGKFWEPAGPFTRFRAALVRTMIDNKATDAMQTAVTARIRDGFGGAAGGGPEGDKGAKRSHKEPELATALIPVVASFKQPALRELLEQCLEVDHPGMQTAAATALARLGHGRAIRAVAKALNTCEYPDDLAVLATAVAKLVEAKSPEPADGDLKFALNIALDKLDTLEDWRARLALLPIVRRIRSPGSVPALIALLAKVGAQLSEGGGRSKSAPASGTLLASVHDALVDLSGYYADARAPEKWQAWWDSVKDTFVLPPADKKAPAEKGATVASTFFGVPVTGNNVVFVVDISGSMAWPYEMPSGTTGATGRKVEFESRLERAKKELTKTLESMPPDSKFNVVFFSDHVKTWLKQLVPATKKNKGLIAKHLERMNASGGTMLYDGLDEAMKIKLRKKKEDPYGSSVDEIFVLTDGSPTVGTVTNTQEILDIVRRWNAGAQVRIHGIYIGDDEVDQRFAPPNTRHRLPGNMRGEEFMERLAEQNHGQFRQPVGKGKK